MNALEHYLRYYCSLEKPGFALLVTGEWGVGKTFQVRRILDALDAERRRPDPLNPENYAYVSLFGISSPEEIDAAAAIALSPSKRHLKALQKFSDKLASSLGGYFSAAALPALLVGPILRLELAQSNNRTLVFDDLERCSAPPDVVRGVINQYVEHLGYRVVLIAHDEKLVGEFATSKEKLVGQTIRVEPDTDAAMAAFVVAISNSCKKAFLDQHFDTIREGFTQSGVQSLRILRHVIDDIGRLSTCLSESQQSNSSACHRLVRWHVTLNSLVRVGNVSRGDLEADSYSYYSERLHKNLNLSADERAFRELVLGTIYERDALGFAGLRLVSSMLIDGQYVAHDIQRALANSEVFGKSDMTESWYVVAHRYDKDDQELFSAIDAMENQFSKGEFTDLGAMLHVFALRLSLSRDGILGDRTVTDAEYECILYLDRLARDSRLPINRLGEGPDMSDLFGSYGLAFAVRDDDETEPAFNRIVTHFSKLVKQDAEQRERQLACWLADHLPNDTEGFFTALESELFRTYPILASVDPDDFVRLAASIPGSKFRRFAVFLNGRLKDMTKSLKPEKEWALRLKAAADIEAERYRATAERERRMVAVRLGLMIGKDTIALVESALRSKSATTTATG